MLFLLKETDKTFSERSHLVDGTHHLTGRIHHLAKVKLPVLFLKLRHKALKLGRLMEVWPRQRIWIRVRKGVNLLHMIMDWLLIGWKRIDMLPHRLMICR